MKTFTRKILSCLLAIIMTVSIFNTLPLPSNAASCIKTQAEAVAWLKKQDYAEYDLDDSYGCQCSDFATAYINFLLYGNANLKIYQGGFGKVLMAYAYADMSLYPSDWKRFDNTASFVPQPGDIFINQSVPHIGVVVSSDVNTAVIVDQNSRDGYGDWGTSAWVKTITWSPRGSGGSYAADYFIRPAFSNQEQPHTHTKGAFAFYLSTHPHENCYYCTGCSEIIRDWSSSNKLNNCIECNRPGKPTFLGMKSEYSVEDTITFKWSSDSNTTHTNFWLYAKDGNDWILIEKKDYANSGLKRKLPSGEYRVEIVAYNSNYWDENHIDHIYSVSPFYYFKVNRVVDSSNIFEDVKSTSWFKQAVDYSVENGLMFGVSNNRFDPDGSTTRAMFVTVLWRLEGKPKTNSNVPFTDIKENWYNDAVTWAYSNKIVSGTEYNKFSPDIKITREQMATILYRYAKNKEYDVTASTDLGTFSDGESASSFASTALSWACGSGLIFGSDGKLLPQDGATRSQVAAILMRYTEKVVQE